MYVSVFWARLNVNGLTISESDFIIFIFASLCSGIILKEIVLLHYEYSFRRSTSSSEANSKSQKLLVFVKMGEKHQGLPMQLLLPHLSGSIHGRSTGRLRPPIGIPIHL